MRMPQRSFVVEFKSGSRQTKAKKSSSIWGDTDLKAALSQVKEQSAHLFNQPEENPAIAGTTVVPAQVERVVCDSQCEDLAIQTKAKAPSPPSQCSEPSLANASSDGNARNSDTRRAERQAIRSAARTERSPTAHKPQSQLDQPRTPARSDLPAAAVGGLDELVSPAELGALEAENRQLKLALYKKLSADNTRLKKMLQRFL